MRAQLGPKPRVIANDAWAKILWAGLNLVAGDLAAAGIRAYYTFFEQCPHRMACARCHFCIPKPSGKAQLLEAKADVDRRLALILLTDGERAAVEQDRQALGKLLGSLTDTPTPAGPTPRESRGNPRFPLVSHIPHNAGLA